MDILGDALGDAPEPVALPAAAPADVGAETAAPAEVSTGPARGPDGKFASAAQPEAAPAAPAVEAGTPPPAGHVPLAALLDQRDELKTLKAKLAQYEQQPRQQAAPPPSVFDDEDAFIAYQQTQMLNTRLDVSEDLARSRHGDDAVNQVQEWFADKSRQSPAFHQEVIGQRNPYEYAITAMKREQALAKIDPADVDDYAAWKASRTATPAGQGQAQPAAASAAPPRPAPPSRSLASSPSAGGVQHIPTGPGNAFDAVF